MRIFTFQRLKQVTEISDVDVAVGPESDHVDDTIWNSTNDEEVTNRFLAFLATRGFKVVYHVAVPHFGVQQFTLISQPHQNVKVRFWKLDDFE